MRRAYDINNEIIDLQGQVENLKLMLANFNKNGGGLKSIEIIAFAHYDSKQNIVDPKFKYNCNGPHNNEMLIALNQLYVTAMIDLFEEMILAKSESLKAQLQVIIGELETEILNK